MSDFQQSGQSRRNEADGGFDSRAHRAVEGDRLGLDADDDDPALDRLFDEIGEDLDRKLVGGEGDPVADVRGLEHLDRSRLGVRLEGVDDDQEVRRECPYFARDVLRRGVAEENFRVLEFFPLDEFVDGFADQEAGGVVGPEF